MNFTLKNGAGINQRIALTPTGDKGTGFTIVDQQGAVHIDPATGELQLCLAKMPPMFNDIFQDSTKPDCLLWLWGSPVTVAVTPPNGETFNLDFDENTPDPVSLGTEYGFYKVVPSIPIGNVYSDLYHRTGVATDAKAPCVITKAERGPDGKVTFEGTCPDDCVLSINNNEDTSVAFIPIPPGQTTFKGTFALPENFEGWIRTRFGSYGSMGVEFGTI